MPRKIPRCKNGHRLDLPDATRVQLCGRKVCAVCERDRAKRFYQRKVGRPVRPYRSRISANDP